MQFFHYTEGRIGQDHLLAFLDGVKDIIYHGKKQCFFIIVHGIDGFLADREFLRQIIHCEFQPFLIEDTQGGVENIFLQTFCGIHRFYSSVR